MPSPAAREPGHGSTCRPAKGAPRPEGIRRPTRSAPFRLARLPGETSPRPFRREGTIRQPEPERGSLALDTGAPAPYSAPMRVDKLYRYPVKGLSPERLSAVALEAGAYFPGDRLFAIENGPSGFDPAAPEHQPKIKFLMLMRNESLARLATRYDDASNSLVVVEGGREAVAGGSRPPGGTARSGGLLPPFHAGGVARASEGARGAGRIPLHGLAARLRLAHQPRERARPRVAPRHAGRSAALSRQPPRRRSSGLGRVRPRWRRAGNPFRPSLESHETH